MPPGLLKGFSDFITAEQVIGEGDLVAIRLKGEATHTGEIMGVKPTGKRVSWTKNEIFRFRDGVAVESWGEGTLGEALAEAGLGFCGAPRK